jgi:hypothetical protein
MSSQRCRQPAGGCGRPHCCAIAPPSPSSESAAKPGSAETAIGAGGVGGVGGRGAVLQAPSAARVTSSARHNGHWRGRRNWGMWVVYVNIIIAVVLVAAFVIWTMRGK